jgi:hypothetical protein
MVVKYTNYDNLDIDLELFRIQNYKNAELVLEPSNKTCLFILGMLFANGANIKILNEKDLSFEDTNKSFTMMPYVWSKLCDDNFPSKDYSNVKTEMDKRIENIKRIGVTTHKIENKPITNKHFLICPVRIATPEQRQWIENYVSMMVEKGYVIHAPHLHTVQTDLFGGYGICMQNAEAIGSSECVDILYHQKSTGSAFDLGVAYAFHKPLNLLNKDDIIFDENDFIDKIVQHWCLKTDADKKFHQNFRKMLEANVETLYVDKDGIVKRRSIKD